MRRIVLLLTCLAAGFAVGYVGFVVSGSQWWYLAIPGAIAVGWLAVANPERCIPGKSEVEGGRHP